MSYSNCPSVRDILRRPIATYIYILTICFFVSILLFDNVFRKNRASIPIPANDVVNSSAIGLIRLSGFDLIKPLLLTSDLPESKELQGIKSKINQIISSQVGSGNIESASVFLRKLSASDCISINALERYNPGSMMKVVVMMAYLKASERDAGLLSGKILFTGHNANLLNEEGNDSQMIPGHYYTVKEIINFMIIDSDNDAMGLLVNNISREKLDEIYTDLNISIINPTATGITMSAAEFAKFYTVLYNGTYLNYKNSELALSILCQSKYNKGLTRDLPPQIKVAHKYGIVAGVTKSLSESGIVYYGDARYLIVVMTKGTDYDKQSDFINIVSDTVFENITAN